MSSLYSKLQCSVAAFAAPNESRPAIAGVLVTPDLMAATDSYSLVEVRNKDAAALIDNYPTVPGYAAVELATPIIVPAKVITALGKSIKKNAKLPILSYAAFAGTKEDSATFITTDLETASPSISRIIPGDFPKYDQLIPTNKPLATVKINPEYLMKVCKIMAEATKSSGLPAMTLELRGETEPVVIRVSNREHDIMALLMPIRS